MAEGRKHVLHKQKKTKLDDVRSEINVTPLVDVCLVLLIIFMVILPLMERGKNIPLPTTRHHVNEGDTQQPIVVVEREGQLYLFGPIAQSEQEARLASIEDLQKRLPEEWKALVAMNERLAKDAEARKGESRVLLKAEPDALYGKVYPVIIALHEAGALGIDLGTNENKEDVGEK